MGLCLHGYQCQVPAFRVPPINVSFYDSVPFKAAFGPLCSSVDPLLSKRMANPVHGFRLYLQATTGGCATISGLHNEPKKLS